LELCKGLIEKYRSGNGRSTMVNGEEFIAKEAVFYINSVSEITDDFQSCIDSLK
jgi:hypothetical protein